MIFVDFETKGLYGPITELAVIEEGKDAELSIPSIISISKYMGNKTLVFWHHYMPFYIKSTNENLFELMRGNFICFSDIGFYLTGKRKIQDITNLLLNRDHKGNALQDVIDLKECFYIGRGRLK